MSKWSFEFDIKRSLVNHFRETIGYRVPAPVGSTTQSATLSGYTDRGVPWGDIYRPGDIFLKRQPSQDPDILAQVAGDVLYVAQSEPGNPVIVCELAQEATVRRPIVRAIHDSQRYEVQNEDDVYIGVRLEQGKNPNIIRSMLSDVVVSEDRKVWFTGEEMFRGWMYCNVEGQNEEATTQVVEALNTSIIRIQSMLYSLDVRVYGRRIELKNVRINERFANSLSFEVNARFTSRTPYGDLPEYIQPGLVTDAVPLTGVTAILEEYGLEDLPRYAEAGEDVILDG